VACMGEMRNAYKILFGMPEGKRPLGRPRRRCQDIKMNIRNRGLESVSQIHVTQDKVQRRPGVDTITKRRVP